MRNLEEIEDIIGYRFHNKKLLRQAMIHSSYANEKKLGHRGSNERLEFLGDAVLEVVSSEFLYRKYPKRSEGELTRLRASMVCEPTLALCARDIQLQEFVLLGHGEEMSGGRNRDSITSDATEALIGAIFLDGGFEMAKSFILSFILSDIENKQLFVDSKTILQELIQGKDSSPIEYILMGEEGPDHDKHFIVRVETDGQVLGCGEGHTKKAAEQAAAYEAVKRLNQKGSN